MRFHWLTRIVKHLALIYFALFFPFIYLDLSVPQMGLLRLVGYCRFANVLPILGYTPLALLLLFLWANSAKEDSSKLRIRIGKTPGMFQAVLIVATMVTVTAIASELPFANRRIGVVQFALMDDSSRLYVAIKIRQDVENPLCMSFTGGACKIYFDNSNLATKESIESILVSHNIPFKTRKYHEDGADQNS